MAQASPGLDKLQVMGQVTQLQFGTPAELVGAVLNEWEKMFAGDPLLKSVALSGGRVMKTFFQEAATRVEFLPLYKRCAYFWADERSVPRDHPESNYKLAQDNFFKPLGIESNIFRIPGEVARHEAALWASEELREFTGAGPGETPVLDLVLLGMGEDGHVASLFPGGVPPSDIGEPYIGVLGPKPPPERVSLSYASILYARHVWVLASGAGKEAALAESLRGPSTPLGAVLQMRPATTIFTDIV